MVTLQHILFPADGPGPPGLTGAAGRDLYLRLTGDAWLTEARRGVRFKPGGSASFDSYFNALALEKWRQNCYLDGVSLGLSGRGRFALGLWHAGFDGARTRLLCQPVELSPKAELRLDLSACCQRAGPGLVYVELTAEGGGAELTGGRFLSAATPQRWPDLAVVITTYRRPDQLRATLARLRAYLAESVLGPRMRVIVVDNGGDVTLAQEPGITYLSNRNLGGAGGFARGLLAAEEAGCSHCLFMDDDAGFGMENLHRSMVFLALNRHPEAAVAGAMISTARPTVLWENGAVFWRRCHPVSGGADLGDFAAVCRLEGRSLGPKPMGFYGGWWFFAFPLAALRHHPFPFFVRGDDISFALANRFRISPLLGVVSFQDDFADKESPLTLYLDLRNHLVQHLTLPDLAIGRFSCAGIALWFLLRHAIRFQYETCDALLLAWRDVIAGPGFFRRNADMKRRRETIAALMRDERFRPLPERSVRRGEQDPGQGIWGPIQRRRRYAPLRWLLKASLNGHFLPFYRLWAGRMVIPARARSQTGVIWGCAELIYLDPTGTRGYRVRLSQRRFWGVVRRGFGLWLCFVLGYGRLRRAYGRAYGPMTSRQSWRRLLGLRRE